VEIPQSETPQPSSAVSQEGNSPKQESGASGDNKAEQQSMATEQQSANKK